MTDMNKLSEPAVDLKLLFLWLSIGYVLIATVIYLSVTSEPVDLDVGLPYEDKFFHALAYFSLMAWFGQIYHGKYQRYILAVAFILMGVGLEYVQSYNHSRYSEIADMVANTVGVVLGFLLTLTQMKNCLIHIERKMFR